MLSVFKFHLLHLAFTSFSDLPAQPTGDGALKVFTSTMIL
jgi:hypothetical protein